MGAKNTLRILRAWNKAIIAQTGVRVVDWMDEDVVSSTNYNTYHDEEYNPDAGFYCTTYTVSTETTQVLIIITAELPVMRRIT